MTNRLLLCLSLIFLAGIRANAQNPAPIAHCIHDNSSGTTAACTLTGLGKNQLVISTGWFYGGAGSTPVADTFGLTWTRGPACQIHRAGGPNDFIILYWAYTGTNTGNDTITNAAITNAAIVAIAYQTGVSSGGPGSGNYACANGTNGTCPCTVSSGSFTPFAGQSLIVGLGENVTTGSAPTAGTGYVLSFTPMGAVVAGMSPWLPFEQQLGNGTSTTINIDSGSNGQIWQMLAASFPANLGGVRHKSSIY